MEVICVYDDGSILQPDVVALTNDDILKDFSTGLTNIAALSMQLGLPTVAAVPHMVVSAFKNLAAVSL
jgi:large subunit ribosomal protein LP0